MVPIGQMSLIPTRLETGGCAPRPPLPSGRQAAGGENPYLVPPFGPRPPDSADKADVLGSHPPTLRDLGLRPQTPSA